MAASKLTALQVNRAQKAGLPAMLADGHGLYLRKQTARGASWTLRYRFGGRERWFGLGNYPDMSLATARIEARRARVLVDKGLDPRIEKLSKLAAHRQQRTFRQLAEDWYSAEVVGRVKHPKVARRHLDNYMFPALGSTVAADVTAEDIARMLDQIRSDYPTAANDLLRYTKRVFDFGVRRHTIHVNPASTLRPLRDAGGAEKPRTRALSEEELRILFRVIKGSSSFGEANELAVKLLLGLCVRKSELLAAKWAEFDLLGKTAQGSVWHLPGSRTKTGADLDIPLVPGAISWLKRLRAIAGESEHVFPRRRHAKRSRYKHVGVDTLNAALGQLDHGLKPFTVHDLRRTARTLLAGQGVGHEVAERCLGHKVGGIAGTYNTHDYFDGRRKALARLVAQIKKLGSAPSSRR